jgi:hypothetical protein
MECPHCRTDNIEPSPYGRPLDGGRAYAQVCASCGRVIGLRPRLSGDPPAAPRNLTDQQIARLRFVRWRLHNECVAQIGRTSPGSEAGPASQVA